MRVSWELYVITSLALARGRALTGMVWAAVKGGAQAIQLREKSLTTRELVAYGEKLRKITREAGAYLIINDRVDVALAVEADGVHLGQTDLPASAARQILGPTKIIGVSVKNEAQALEAEGAGADYVSVGPIFPTTSKEDAGLPVGLETLKVIRKSVSLPVFAIGGINLTNIREAIAAGADGVAVISAVMGALEIEKAALALRQLIRAAKARG